MKQPIKNIFMLITVLILNGSTIYATTFDFESNIAGDSTSTMTQTLSGQTIEITVSKTLFKSSSRYGFVVNGSESIAWDNTDAETSYSISLVSGDTFNLESLALVEGYSVENETLLFTSSKGTLTDFINVGDPKTVNILTNLNTTNMQGITSFTITAPTGDGFLGLVLDDIILTNITAPSSTNPEPTNQPTAFTATSNSTSQITTTWTDDTAGAVVPDGYLVMCNKTGTFTAPTDNTAQTDDTSCADGSGVQNIAQGTGTVAWSGLDAGTQYFYTIYPYTNSGTDVDYKIDGTVLTANATTTVVLNSDATLISSSTISEPINLSSTADTSAEAVSLFDFTLSDGGGGDTLSTDVSQIVLHTSGTADFSKVTWQLNGADASNVTGTYNAGANTLTFTGLSISVADGSSKTYTVLGFYSTATGLTNKQTYLLSLDGDDDLTLSASGTQMSGGNTAVTNGTGTLVDITASKLIFQTLPSN